MKRTKLLLTALICFMTLSLYAPATQGQDNGSDTLRTRAEIREDIQKIQLLLRTFDNVCVVILNGQLAGVKLQILEARKLITVGKGNLGGVLLGVIQSAGADFEQFVNLRDNFCAPLLDEISSQVQSASAEIDALKTLDPRKRFKIVSILDHLVGGGLANMDELLTASLEEASPGACPQQSVATSHEKGPIPLGLLRLIKQCLGKSLTVINHLLSQIKRIVMAKKWVLKGLVEVEHLLRGSGFARFTQSVSTIYFFISDGLQVHRLDGRPAGVTRDIMGELRYAELPNGVYLYVQAVRAADGSAVRSEVKKHAILR
jgi:hypothetical protein